MHAAFFERPLLSSKMQNVVPDRFAMSKLLQAPYIDMLTYLHLDLIWQEYHSTNPIGGCCHTLTVHRYMQETYCQLINAQAQA